jgi:nucleotide-binding universal stress UspA family protein
MFPLRKILVPTDFSPAAAAALDCAAEFARKFDAEILLLHALPTLAQVVPFPMAVPLPLEWTQAVHQQARVQLDKEAKRVERVRITTEFREGPVHDSVLAAVTASKADLVVMGTHGRRGLVHAMLGSVAERIVRNSPVPVLTVRARG